MQSSWIESGSVVVNNKKADPNPPQYLLCGWCLSISELRSLIWFSTELTLYICYDSKLLAPGPSSSMMGYSPIAEKSPIDQMGKNIWGKLMIFFPIRSIYLNGKNYHKLLLHYGENLWGKLMGKIYGEINGENLWGKYMRKN